MIPSLGISKFWLGWLERRLEPAQSPGANVRLGEIYWQEYIAVRHRAFRTYHDSPVDPIAVLPSAGTEGIVVKVAVGDLVEFWTKLQEIYIPALTQRHGTAERKPILRI